MASIILRIFNEITVGILNGKALPIIEILPDHKLYDYKCKYTPGMTKYICPASLPNDLSDKIRSDSLKIFDLLDCKGYVRVDYRLDENNNHFFYLVLQPVTLLWRETTSHCNERGYEEWDFGYCITTFQG